MGEEGIKKASRRLDPIELEPQPRHGARAATTARQSSMMIPLSGAILAGEPGLFALRGPHLGRETAGV